MNTIAANDLYELSKALLKAAGFANHLAEDTAKVLVWANLRGADSHGVLRIPRYVEMVESGRMDPQASPGDASFTGAVAQFDARHGPGATAMLAAIDRAVELAHSNGIGWCSAKNITHSGAIGYYAMQATTKRCIGIVMSASVPLMAYHGARVSGLSTNPIAIAVPQEGQPLLLDMSTSTVPLGKIMQAKDTGADIPLGWGIDKSGAPTTEPAKVAMLTPLGGPKGSGLSMMIEVLASVLVSNPVISEALSGRKPTMNGLALALNIGSFTNPDVFASQIMELVGALGGLPKAPGVDTLFMPGERGFQLADRRLREGIPLAAGTVTRLAELGERLNIDHPDISERLHK